MKFTKEVNEAGIEGDRVANDAIPDSAAPEVREQQLTANYAGNVGETRFRSWKLGPPSRVAIFVSETVPVCLWWTFRRGATLSLEAEKEW